MRGSPPEIDDELASLRFNYQAAIASDYHSNPTCQACLLTTLE